MLTVAATQLCSWERSAKSRWPENAVCSTVSPSKGRAASLCDRRWKPPGQGHQLCCSCTPRPWKRPQTRSIILTSSQKALASEPFGASQKASSANPKLQVSKQEKKRKLNQVSVSDKKTKFAISALSNFRCHLQTSMFFCFNMLTEIPLTNLHWL